MTNAQAREARRLLNLSTQRLSMLCDFPSGAIHVFERTGYMSQQAPSAVPKVDRLTTLQNVLEEAGVEFIEQDGSAGVRMRKPGGGPG